MSPLLIGIIGICVFLVLLFLKMPIGFAMALTGFTGFWAIRGLTPALSVAGLVAYSEGTKYMLSAVPIFVFMGHLATQSELTKSAFTVANKWIGRLRGGLAMSSVVGAAAFGAVCGDHIATAATMVPVSLPELRRHKYADHLSLGSIAAGGNLGFMIPPSIGFIIYGLLAEESIGALFMAGILPGILLTFMFCVTVYILCRMYPNLGPSGPKTTWGEKLGALRDVWGIIVLFVLVMGGIYTGFFTATEAASVGAFGAFVLGLINRKLTWPRLLSSLHHTGSTTAMLFVLIIGAFIFSAFMTISGVPIALANFISGLQLNSYIIIALILLFFIFTGLFMDIIAIMMITVPIFAPVVHGLGFDLVWFGVLIMVTMLVGSITPPVGILVFTVGGMVRDVPMYLIFRGVIPFIIAMIVFLILLVAFPNISLFLPDIVLPYR